MNPARFACVPANELHTPPRNRQRRERETTFIAAGKFLLTHLEEPSDQRMHEKPRITAFAFTDDFGIACPPDLAADIIPDVVIVLEAFSTGADTCPSPCP